MQQVLVAYLSDNINWFWVLLY